MKYLILSFFSLMFYIDSAYSQCTITGSYDSYICNPTSSYYLWQGPTKGGYVKLQVNQVMNGYYCIAAGVGCRKDGEFVQARVRTSEGTVIDIRTDQDLDEYIYVEYTSQEENATLYYLDGSSGHNSDFSIEIMLD